VQLGVALAEHILEHARRLAGDVLEHERFHAGETSCQVVGRMYANFVPSP
jgi:hypothetical protein